MAAGWNATQNQEWVERTLGFCALLDMEIGDCKHRQKETAASQHKDKVMKIHSSQDPQK